MIEHLGFALIGSRLLISADGRYVAYVSAATNLVAGDTNAKTDIFVHDRQTGSTTRSGLAARAPRRPA